MRLINSQELVLATYSSRELWNNPDKNSIKLKFGTEVENSVRNDEKSPIDCTLGTSFFGQIHHGGSGVVG